MEGLRNDDDGTLGSGDFGGGDCGERDGCRIG